MNGIRRTRRVLRDLARRPTVVVIAIVVFTFLGAASVGARLGPRVPAVHDEFGYLLGADTFARGRVTNPTHPHWRHFESYQVFHEPTYQSKYPPAQALALAAGQVLFGHPIAGVWLSVALMCGAIAWMLFAWVPPRSATAGGVLVAVQVGLVSYWSQTYWGGAVAATGGALLFGAARRWTRSGRACHALVAAAGFAILANSRPYEGSLAAIGAVGLVAASLATKVHASRALAARGESAFEARRGHRDRDRGAGSQAYCLYVEDPATKRSVARARRSRNDFHHGRLAWWPSFVVVVLVLAPVAGLMAAYNERLTGNAMTLPYAHYHDLYGRHPLDLDSAPGADQDAGGSRFGDGIPTDSRERAGRSTARTIRDHLVDLLGTWVLFVGVAWTPALAFLPRVLRRGSPRHAALIVALVAAGTFGSWSSHPHYLAPVAGLIVLLLVECIRRLAAIRSPRRRLGSLILLAMLLGCIVDRGADVATRSFFNQHDRMRAREEVRVDLTALGGRHLVFVRYGPRHLVHREWVYNGADIDGEAVVWARDLGPAANRRLLDAMSDRAAWSLVVDDDGAPPDLRAYEGVGTEIGPKQRGD